ncbi:hypothetical protein TNCV_1674501 [Trichonephila clavipes]|nr:hypothetical protein TNCV_1674501 [Trichonephila clavipes]
MIVGSNSQGVVLPQEDRVPGYHVALLIGKTTVFGLRLQDIACPHTAVDDNAQISRILRSDSLVCRPALSRVDLMTSGTMGEEGKKVTESRFLLGWTALINVILRKEK